LIEVELCEGIVEIGQESFAYCDHSITNINIPTSLRRIDVRAFQASLRCPIRLHDGIESIGEFAFAFCIFTNFRVPPLITVILNCMLYECKSIFSVEMPKNVTEINIAAFMSCYCLRNVAIPPNAVISGTIFIDEEGYDDYQRTDLQLLFGSEALVVIELRHRFRGLPIHELLYYQSYHQGVLQNLIARISRNSFRRWTGNQQDCLGMTPLHILACSSVHDLELYRVIVENYPKNLITEDSWGALPLLYAFWGAAPAEIIQFLLGSYQSLYPDHVFNWTMMVETMGRCDTPKERIENLLCVKGMHFPDQPLDWEYLLNQLTGQSNFCMRGSKFYLCSVLFQERMQFLVTCGMTERVEALAFKVWRDHITNMIQTSNFEYGGEESQNILRAIREKLAHFEDELPKLKEAATLLKLALWKKRINDTIQQQKTARSRKKAKTEAASS
jgi:hypothetical protein